MIVKVICCGWVMLSRVTTTSQIGETQLTPARVLTSRSVIFTAESMRRRLELIVATKMTLVAAWLKLPGGIGGGEGGGGEGGGEGGGGEGGGEAEDGALDGGSKESVPDHSTISAIILEQLAAQRAASDAGAPAESAAL